jgi:hypothetical protein
MTSAGSSTSLAWLCEEFEPRLEVARGLDDGGSEPLGDGRVARFRLIKMLVNTIPNRLEAALPLGEVA